MTFALRGAAVLFWLSAIGLGVCCIIAIRSVLTNGDIAYVFGYPTFGRGNFERHGLMTTVPLLLAFLAVCLLEALAGWLVWQGRSSGGILALAVLPLGATFWWGFDLPYPPILALARTVLSVVAWRSLTSTG